MDLRNFGIITCFFFTSVTLAQEISLQVSTDDPVSIDDDVTFHCRVDDFPPGGAINWWKRQGDEEVIIGKNNKLEIAVDRYELLVKQANTAVLFYLNIRGVQLADNGEFGCSLDSDPERKVYRNLVVSDHVRQIHLYRIPSANSSEVTYEFKDGETLPFTADESYFFKCVAEGSNPPPVMQFTIGYQKNVQILTDKFLRTDKLISAPSTGDVAFRKTNYKGVLTSMEAITIDWKANTQEMRCSASVSTMDEPLSIYITPILKLAPVIECADSMKVALWTPDVSFTCKVYADPPLQAIRWYWGNEYRGTSLDAGEALGAFRFDLLPGDKPDMKLARLTIDRVFIQMYGRYHLAAKNEKGLTIHVIELVRDTKNEKKVPSATAKNAASPILITIFISLISMF